ncbi:hypothetical protein BJF93_15130 [Xaviernesmea oryzae]|uniref:SnoaL-like domain-containing protein n=1 Tax=Xaviernesmea oryzae TaxID=464029 RepID=A0A1Q9AXY3_9HYPH|nr:DUF4440 domain-containing protein [Xaviernesmea oryzae]OLP60290.1 hypothetical protein BJF93_15130 [Xaviernesmea oryzae]SEK24679.1 SnoaL-like domain-containing protein [Xaviernesmea oryzae]
MSEANFKQFLLQREKAAEAYVRGDTTLLDALSTQADPATFFGPSGTTVKGAKAVTKDYGDGANTFQPGAETHFEILQSAAGGDVAYWAGYQHATASMSPGAPPQSLKLRVTELYRREHGEWKLVHRHADPARD